MGKSEERNDAPAQVDESTFLPKGSTEASKMLEAALLQMDDIISGKIQIYELDLFNRRFGCFIYDMNLYEFMN